MLAGDMTLRSFDANEQTQRAITFNCLDTGNATGAAGEFNHFPLHNCPSGMRAQVFFPQCWDGQSLDSANHKSHVAYPSGVDSGDCPASHPVRLIAIFYEFVYDSGAFAADWWDGGSPDIGQPFVLAQGDPTGELTMLIYSTKTDRYVLRFRASCRFHFRLGCGRASTSGGRVYGRFRCHRGVWTARP